MAMRDPNREEVAAMWLYGADYAYQSLGIVEWWARQPDSRKRHVRDFLHRLDTASDMHTKSADAMHDTPDTHSASTPTEEPQDG